MKVFLLSFSLILAYSFGYSQVDTIQYSLKAFDSGDSILFQFNGKYSMNFSFAKNQKWKGEKFKMWNANGAYLIERKGAGEVYFVQDTFGKLVATLTTNSNGMPDKITLTEGALFQYKVGNDGNWKVFSNGKIYQLVNPRGLRKKEKKRHVEVYNQLTDEKDVKLFHSLSHIGLLHYAFIREGVRSDINLGLSILNLLL